MNKNESLALLFSLVAGLSTGIGSIAMFFTKYVNTKVLDFSLGFSAGVMLHVALGDLMIEAQELMGGSMSDKGSGLLALVFLIIGILLSAFIEGFVPDATELKVKGQLESAKIFRIGIVSVVVIALHNFPEGIATFSAGYHGMEMGLPITFAVAMHNIPEGMCVAMPIYFATKSRKKAFTYSVLTGLAEPLGALVTFLFLRPFLNDFLLGIIFAIVSGTMLFITFSEILPTSWEHGHKGQALCGVLAGILAMGVCFVIV